MADNFDNLLHPGDCIPEKVLLAYLEGKLVAPQMHVVEKHLLGCEFCSDALEGLKSMQPGRSREIIDELNAKIDNTVSGRTSGAGKVVPFSRYYRIAAVISLFILFGGGYWYLKNAAEEKSLAENNQSAVHEKAEPNIPQFESAGSRVPDSAETVSTQPPEKINAGKKSAPSAGSKERNQVSDIAANNDEAFRTVSEIKNEEAKSGNMGSAKEQAVKSAIQAEPAAHEEADDHAFSKNPAEGSSATSRASTEARPDLFYEDVLYNKAKTNFDRKNYTEAAVHFEKLIADTTSRYYDDSKWYLAVCYTKTHQNIKARALLKEIAHSTGAHKKEAEGLLQELQ